jgi:hypothetical protein
MITIGMKAARRQIEGCYSFVPAINESGHNRRNGGIFPFIISASSVFSVVMITIGMKAARRQIEGCYSFVRFVWDRREYGTYGFNASVVLVTR